MALRPAYGYQAQIAGGIAGLAEAAKEVSNGRLFTMSYYGYDTAVMALLLGREGIDGLSTVYEYKPITRNFSGPLVLPWMLMDGMAAAGKLMLVEDDTRTVLSCKTNPHTTNKMNRQITRFTTIKVSQMLAKRKHMLNTSPKQR